MLTAASFNEASGVLAVLAAGLWLKASLIKTPRKLDAIIFTDMGAEGELPELFEGVHKQSRWNAAAALSSGFAAAAQAAAAFLT